MKHLRRLLVILPVLALTLALAACGGKTTGASNVGTTTAVLNYEGHCDPGDSGYWLVEYQQVGETTWTDGPHRTLPSQCATERVPASGEAPLSDSITNLTPGTQYRYRASVRFSNGSSAWTDSTGTTNGTNYHTFTTQALPADDPPSAPADANIENVTQDSAEFHWEPGTDDDDTSLTYELDTDANGTPNESNLVHPDDSPWSLEALECGTTYSAQVRSVDDVGDTVQKSAWVTRSFTTDACDPPADTEAPSTPNPTAGSITQTGATITWPASTDNVGVTGYVSDRGAGVNEQTHTPTDRTRTLTGLTCATSYTVGVRAQDAAGNNSPRGTVTFTTSACSTGTGKRGLGFWLTDAEVASLPTNTAAWNDTLAAANAYGGVVNLSNQDSSEDVQHLAQAIVGKRLNDTTRLNEVRAGCANSWGSTAGGRVLGISRQLPSFIAGCAIAGVNDSTFRSRVANIRNEQGHECNGRADSILECYRDRPNNWGTMAGAALSAANSYLEDSAALTDVAETFHDFVGRKTRAQGATFVWASPAETYDCGGTLTTTHGITPEGCTKSGVNLSGAVPDDERRCGAFTSPPCTGATYPWETRQGISVQAVILQRAGFPVSTWQNNATDRMYDYMHRYHLSTLDAEDQWQVNLDSCLDGSTLLPATSNGTSGKNMGWTQLTHTTTSRCQP